MFWFGYPVRVLIFRRYGNVIKPVLDRARYEERKVKTPDGEIIKKYLVLQKTKAKIPAPDITDYYDIENKRWLYLYQIDRDTFYPCSVEGGRITVRIQEPIIEKGKVKGYKIVEKPLFDGNVVISEDGTVINIETLVSKKTYDKEQWLASEIEAAQRIYRSKHWLERYGNYITLGLIILGMIMVLQIGLQKYAEITNAYLKGVKEVATPLNNIFNELKDIARHLGVNATAKPIPKPPPH